MGKDVFKYEFYFPPESAQYEAALSFLQDFAQHLEEADELGIEVSGKYKKPKKPKPKKKAKEVVEGVEAETVALEEATPMVESAPASADGDGIPIITIRACPGKRP
jgi:exonuclease VII small subunit